MQAILAPADGAGMVASVKPLPTDDPIIEGVLRFWIRARGDRALPSKADVDPIGLGAKLLPHLLIVQRVDNGRYLYRLCGTANTEAAGLDLTGRHIDELNPNPGYIGYITSLYDSARAERRPIYSESRYLGLRTATRRSTRRLICPLTRPDGEVGFFLTGQTFQQEGSSAPLTVGAADQFEPALIMVL